MRVGLRGSKCRGWGGVGPQKAQYKNSRQIAHKASKRQSSPCPKTYSAVFGKRQQKCCIPRWMAVHSKGGALLEGRMGDMGVVNGRMDAGATMTTTSKRRMQRRKRCVYS